MTKSVEVVTITVAALTTTFTPPPSCTHLTQLSSPGYEIWLNEPQPVPETKFSDCYPSAFVAGYTYVRIPSSSIVNASSSIAPMFSPLVCPQGWHTAQEWENGYIACCASGYELHLPDTTSDSKRSAYGGTCYSQLTVSQTLTVTAFDSASATATVEWVASTTPAQVFGHVIDGFKLEEETSSNSALSSSTGAIPAQQTSSAPSSSSSSGGISGGAVAGIVVGVVAAMVVAAAATFCLIRRRYRAAGGGRRGLSRGGDHDYNNNNNNKNDDRPSTLEVRSPTDGGNYASPQLPMQQPPPPPFPNSYNTPMDAYMQQANGNGNGHGNFQSGGGAGWDKQQQQPQEQVHTPSPDTATTYAPPYQQHQPRFELMGQEPREMDSGWRGNELRSG
ncbi:hypothetical protein GGR56DRAFT_688448 [Xylariaceae sp. FL0804]|nr:hypothetical protein GGR56DRAFT_688448 [Xylariaceae sp. FL0804]